MVTGSNMVVKMVQNANVYGISHIANLLDGVSEKREKLDLTISFLQRTSILLKKTSSPRSPYWKGAFVT